MDFPTTLLTTALRCAVPAFARSPPVRNQLELCCVFKCHTNTGTSSFEMRVRQRIIFPFIRFQFSTVSTSIIMSVKMLDDRLLNDILESAFQEIYFNSEKLKSKRKDSSEVPCESVKDLCITAVEAFGFVQRVHYYRELLPKSQLEKIAKLKPVIQEFIDWTLKSRAKLENHTSDDLLLEQAERLDMDGILQDAHKLQLGHDITAGMKNMKKMKLIPSISGVDEISANNRCMSSIEELRLTTILALRKNVVTAGSILWLQTVSPALHTNPARIIVMDREGTHTTLNLFNYVDTYSFVGDMTKLFPVGSNVGIKNPYLKMVGSGYLELRVDHPCNVVKL